MASDQTKPASRSWLVNAAGIVVAFTLLGLALYNNREQVWSVLRGPLDVQLFLAALALNFAGLVLTFVRWYVLVRALGIPFRLRDALRLGFIGNVFNLVIPGAVGGDLIKALYLTREHAQKEQAIASMVIDRVVGLLGLFLLAGLMGLGTWSAADLLVRRLIVVVWVALAAGLVGLAILFTPALYGPLNRLVRGRRKLERILSELEAAASAYRKRLAVVIAMLFMAMCIHSLYVLSFYEASRAIFPSVPTLGQHFLIVPLCLFTTAVPLPFGALGLSEQVTQQMFKLVNHPTGAVSMMAYRVLMYAGGFLSACVYLANLRTVRTISHQDPREREELEQALDAV